MVSEHRDIFQILSSLTGQMLRIAAAGIMIDALALPYESTRQSSLIALRNRR